MALHPFFKEKFLYLRISVIAFLTIRWPLFFYASLLAGFWWSLVVLEILHIFPLFVQILITVLFISAAIGLCYYFLKTALMSKREKIALLAAHNNIDVGKLILLNDHYTEENTPDVVAANNQNSLLKKQQNKILKSLPKLKMPLPHSNLYIYDRYGVRVVLLLFIAWAALSSPHDFGYKLQSLYLLEKEQSELQLRAWINPPQYSNDPAKYILQHNSALNDQNRYLSDVEVMQFSILHISSFSKGEDEIQAFFYPIENGAKPIDLSALNGQVEDVIMPSEQKQKLSFPLKSSGHIVIQSKDNQINQKIQINVIEDTLPIISFISHPQPNLNQQLEIHYKINDDHGISAAKAVFDINDGHEKISNALYSAPNFSLLLPSNGDDDGRAKTLLDTASHPFAGQKLELTLQATDRAEQISYSRTIDVMVPSKKFANELAASLVDLRGRLALDRAKAKQVKNALNALSLFPENFDMDFSIYLGLVTAKNRLNLARNDDDLRSVVDQLWHMALYLEDGDVAEARQAFENARKQLQNLLQNGGTDKQIQEAMEELRKTFSALMQEMMRQAQNNQNSENNAENSAQNGQEVASQDLDQLLKAIENAARGGERAEAQNLLNALNSIMQNLQIGQGNQQGSQSNNNDQSQGILPQLQKLIEEQTKLLEKTFDKSEKGKNSLDAQDRQTLSQEQNQLNQELDNFLNSLPNLPNENNGEMSQGQDNYQQFFDDALQQMQGAEEGLQMGRSSKALKNQGEALNTLQQAGSALARKLLEQSTQNNDQQNGQGPSTNNPFAETDRAGYGKNPFSGRHEIDKKLQLNKAREILLEIYKSLEKKDLTQDQHDYLKRLLDLNSINP